MPLTRLSNELFSTDDETNKYTSATIGEMAVTALKALLADIRYKKKSTTDHLSSSGVRFCWYNTYDANHAGGLFKISVNDTTELSFGSIIGQLQSDGKTVLNNAVIVIQVIVNGDL